MKNRGFTLLELMIAVSILAFLSFYTSVAIRNAIRSKEKIQRDLDKSATVRDALKVIERDINDAFNYRDFNAQLFNMSLKVRAQRQPQPTPVTPTAPGVNPPIPGTPGGVPQAFQEHYQPKVEFKYCGFIGEKNSLDFTTLSNVRMAEDQQVSRQAEIGYHLRNCRRRAQQNSSTNCLWRRVAPVIDNDLEKGGEETVLLENVQKFDLRYLGPGHEKEWIDQWITTDKGDATTKGKFPYAVEITLEVQDKSSNAKDKPLRMTIVAAVRNPNNPPPTPQQDPNNPNAVPDPNAMPGGVPGMPGAPGQPGFPNAPMSQ